MSQVHAELPIELLVEPSPRERESRAAWWFPVAIFGAVAFVLFAIVAITGATIADGSKVARSTSYYHGPKAIEAWLRWDANWYRNIVDHGYFFSLKHQSSVAFFPVYPLAMRFLHDAIGGDPSAWGVAITFVSGLVTAVLFHRWCRARLRPSAANTSILLLLLWPYAWYLFGAVYADALFVAMTLLAFTFVEKDRPLLAALAGAVATATRPVGAAVVIGLLARTLERRGALQIPAADGRRAFAIDLRRLRPLDPTVLLAAAGLIAYAAYLWHEFGEPLAFARAESAPGWDQKPGPRTWFKFAWWSRLFHLPGSGLGYFGAITFQALLAAGLLLLVPLVFKRFGWAYALYTLCVLAIPLFGSKDFMGIGRYALTAFPSFAVLGEKLDARPRTRTVWLLASGSLLVALCTWYARGRYVA